MNKGCRLVLWLLPLGFASCGAVKTFKDTTVAAVGKLPALPTLASLPKWPGDRPAVVKVRHKDLKKFPLGHERAMAFQPSQRFNRWPGDVKFEPAALPDPGAETSGSVLPEIMLPPP